MSATIGAALKKIAVALFTNPKVLKTVLGIVLGIVIALITPILAVIAVFNGGIKLDTEKLQQMITENLSAADQAMLQQVEDTMYAIEDEMTAAGFTGRIMEAQVLYILALEDHAGEPGFVSKLVGCFTAEQTDEQLIAAVNAAFGTELTAEEFGQVMGDIRSTAVDTSDWTDTAVKNNLDLVRWAQDAADNGWGYVYGTYGALLDEELLMSKITQYPDEVGSDEAFIRQNWLGKRTADCVGLIKGYGWYDAEKQQTVIDTEKMPDIGADTMYENAAEKGTIDTIPEIPGLAVWHEGHIGVYIGDGEVVQAANTRDGVIRSRLWWKRSLPAGAGHTGSRCHISNTGKNRKKISEKQAVSGTVRYIMSEMITLPQVPGLGGNSVAWLNCKI